MKTLKNKKFLAGMVSLVLLSVFFIPIFVGAADPDDGFGSGLIRCGNSTTTDSAGKVVFKNPCDFDDFIGLINGVVNWIIGIAGVIFTISAVWGGFLYMTSGTSLGDKEKAKSILWSTLLGFVIILCAWLIVYTILRYMVGEDSDVLRFLK